ncbi:DMT family transporter [Neptunicoccus cionae]|uniref:DMT family transporter n=1 Tax=Neptunicoccus cionae TaxID=2035344 RepID=UPI00336A5B9F
MATLVQVISMASDTSDMNYGRPWVGIGWMLLTGVLFVGVTGIVRYVGSSVPAAEAAFIRYLFGVLFILPFMGTGWLRQLDKRLVGTFALRGFCHAIGVILWFYAMARIPIAEVTAIGYLAPIYIAIGAAVFLGEKLALRRIAAIVIAFIGAMIILRPGIQEINSGQMAQVLSAPMFAVSYLVAKRLTAQAGPSLVVGMLSVFVTIGIAPFAIAVWKTPSVTEVLWLALVGALATTAHFTMTKALKAAPLAVTQPVTFLQLIWATILGLVVFGEAVDIFVLLGGGLIICSVSFISYREWVLSRRAKTPPAAAVKT